MEKNLPAQQKPYSPTGASRIEEAKQSKSIHNASQDELEEVLKHIFFMVGFTKADVPDKVENAVMIDFLQTEYPKLSLDEMKLAFKMGISGKFQVDASTYGKRFSPAYVAKFINGYDQHKLSELKVAKQKEAYPYEKQVETPEDKKVIEEAIAKLKEKFVEPIEKLKIVSAKGFGETDYNHEKVISYEDAKFLSQNINPKTNE